MVWENGLREMAGPDRGCGMYASVVAAQLRPGMAEEARRIWHGAILPHLDEVPGLRGLKLLADWPRGKLLVVTLYENEAVAREAEVPFGPYQQAMAIFGYILAAPPERTVCEVRVQVEAPGGAGEQTAHHQAPQHQPPAEAP
jgi:hypothetical protein